MLAGQEHYSPGQRFAPGSQFFCRELGCCNPGLFGGFLYANLREALSPQGVLARCGLSSLA